MKFREFDILGSVVLMGKNAEQNDELVKQFQGKENIIMHTVAPGSGFCIIDDLHPSNKIIKQSAILCAAYSQDWRDNQGNVKINIFTGKDVEKKKGMKTGTWKVKKGKTKTIKKKDIEKFI